MKRWTRVARRIRQDLSQPQLERLEDRRLLVGSPIIAEFQAINQTTRVDQDGDPEDWIEIRNPDAAPLALAGWHLTDDPTDLTKWEFPAVTLGAGEQLLVYASNKNRRDPQQELHTNFRLSGEGEYLALVRPDGVTVEQAFNPFPVQYPDQSYGLATGREATSLMSEQQPVRVLVPTDGSLGLDWTQPSFNDASWTLGSLGVSYEVLQPGFTVRDDFTTPLGQEWTTNIPAGGTSTVAVVAGKLSIQTPNNQTMNSTERGTAPMVIRDIPNGAADWELITHVSQGRTDRGVAGLSVINGATGLPVLQFEYSSRLNFRLLVNDVSAGSVTSLSRDAYFMRLVRDSRTATYSAYFRLAETDEWRLVATATDGTDVPAIDNARLALHTRTPTSTMNAQFDFVELNIPDQLPVYGPFSGLDVAGAMHGKNASAYLRVPFTVTGDPQEFDELALVARYDDGFRAFLNGVDVTAQNVPIDSQWNSTASAVFGAVNGRIPSRQIDISQFRNLLKAGENVLAVQGMNVAADDADFFFDTSLVATTIVGSKLQYFAVPSPGSVNATPAAPPARVIGEPGIYFGSTEVSLALDEPNPQLEIRYTLDGSEPTRASALYTQPITLTETAMLEARAFDNSVSSPMDPSPITSATFIALAESLRERTSDIPLIIIDTMGQGLPGSGATTLAGANVIAVEVSQATGRASLGDPLVNYLGRGGVRDRGSSTGGQAKPNMAFETWGAGGNDSNDDEDVELLGFAAESDFVLHAPFTFDRAMIRNQLAFAMANSLGRWAPGTRPVEVYLNRGDGVVADNDYHGVYILMDKIKQGPDRVDIAAITPEDNAEPEISGGYIWKIDREDPGEPAFSAGGVSLNWVEPKSPNGRSPDPAARATQEQQAWVVDYFNKFRDAARTPDINDPEGYSKYIDVGSWIDNHLVFVLGDNVDALNLSTYLHKDRGKKIEFGPQWDYDRAMESDDNRDDNPLLWGGSGGTAFFTSNLWSQLFRDSGFWQAYVDRWTELRRAQLSDTSLNALIDKLAGQVAESQARNFTKWPGSRGRRSSPYNSGKLDGTWQGEVEHLRTWLLARAHFMDGNFVQPPSALLGDDVIPIGGKAVTVGTQVELAGPQVTFFDDEELISSEVGVATARYFAPSDDTLGTTWAQVGFDDSSWASGKLGIGFDGGSSFGDFIATEARPATGGTTILLRIPFELADPSQLKDLVLRARYDDGFVAYLNGVEVLRENLRDDDLAWNSRASSHVNSEGQRFEDFDLSAHESLLVPGQNLLAIRMINASTTSNDAFIQPALVSREVKFGLSPNGKVYYTTDGSDPRGADGNPSPGATLAVRGESIAVQQNMRIIARNFDDVTDLGSEARIVRTRWSAPATYTLVVDDPNLVISEINFNPAPPTQTEAQAGWDADDFEFIEIHNAGSTASQLVGVALQNAVEFDFFGSSSTTLAPGAYGVVVANPQAFQQRYGDQVPVFGQYSGQLNNAGDTLALVDGTGRSLFAVEYGDSGRWGEAADGRGATLELLRPDATPAAAQGKWYNWRASREFGGSPGTAGLGPTGIVVNEVRARGNGDNAPDAIELHNTSNQSVDISGWYLSDSANNLLKFRIPAGTVIGAGQYVVFDERQFNADPPLAGSIPFGLNGVEGDNVWLVAGDGQGGVRWFIDDVHFGAVYDGQSLGRIPNGSGQLTPLTGNSFGQANSNPRIGPVIISEVQYHALPNEAALAAHPNLDESDLEFIEIRNPTAGVVNLSGWQLAGGVGFEFPAGTELRAGESVVVLKFDPDDPENLLRRNAFVAQYALSESVRLLGGYQGQLRNSDDLITLHRIDAAEPGVRLPEDQVLYDDLAPWPTSADGLGSSLNRVSPSGPGHSSPSWFAAAPSPGTAAAAPSGDFNGDGSVNAADINLFFVQMRSPSPDLAYDLDGNGRVDAQDRDLLIGTVIGTTYGDIDLDKRFDSADLVRIAQAGEYEDGIAGNSTWEDGDWDGDGDVSTRDLVLAFQRGVYLSDGAARPAASQIFAHDRALAELDLAKSASDEPNDSLIETDELGALVDWLPRTTVRRQQH
jgi:hypothetical protein